MDPHFIRIPNFLFFCVFLNLMGQNICYAANVSSITFSHENGCVLFSDHSLRCYGKSDPDILGFQAKSDSEAFGVNSYDLIQDTWPKIDFGGNFQIEQISFNRTTEDNFTYICARSKQGAVKCWSQRGSERNRPELGIGWKELPEELDETYPNVSLSADGKAVDLQVGSNHACVLFESRKVKCWGKNNFGQLGQGDQIDRGITINEMEDQLHYIELGGSEKVSSLSVGGNHTCVILEEGTLKCWGDNRFGQLGYGDLQNRGTEPRQMSDELEIVSFDRVSTAKKVVTGLDHTCVLSTNNQVKCWGRGDMSQNGSSFLAVGDDSGEMGSSLPDLPLANKNSLGGIISQNASQEILDLYAGDEHSCVLILEGGDVLSKCWGKNITGELAIGNIENQLIPDLEKSQQLITKINFTEPATRMHLGRSSSCLQFRSGDLKCWGLNNFGILGTEQKDLNSIGSSDNQLGINLMYSVFTQQARDKNREWE